MDGSEFILVTRKFQVRSTAINISGNVSPGDLRLELGSGFS